MIAYFRFFNFEEELVSEDFIGASKIEIDSINDILNVQSLSDTILRALVSNKWNTSPKKPDSWQQLIDSYVDNGAEIINTHFEGLDGNSGELQIEYDLELKNMKVALFIDLEFADEIKSVLQNLIGNKLMA